MRGKDAFASAKALVAMMDWVDRVKAIKQARKMTNEQLADLSGIPVGTLNKLLAKATLDPKFSTVVALAEALDSSLDDLAGTCDRTPSPIHDQNDSDQFARRYASLDTYGREMVAMVLNKEYTRVMSQAVWSAPRTTPVPEYTSSRAKTKPLPLYDMPVSAGCGTFLEDSATQDIAVTVCEQTKSADFALRISGNSMEPKYHDGDILLVHEQPSLLMGELGIFVLDGEGYFKRFGGDRLISLNRSYTDIPITAQSDIRCVGRVIGKLKKKL